MTNEEIFETMLHNTVSVAAQSFLIPFALAGRLPTTAEVAVAVRQIGDAGLAVRFAELIEASLACSRALKTS